MELTFSNLLPDLIFSAVESCGGRCTGYLLQLNAMENRVYDLEMEDESHRVVKFYRPGRWSKEVIQAEHDFLLAAAKHEIPVITPLSDKNGKTVGEIDGIYFGVFQKCAGRLEGELDKERFQRLGRYLAQLHNIGAGFKKVVRPTLNADTFGRGALEILLREGVIPTNFRPLYSTLVEQVSSLADSMFKGVTPILVHGDCHVGNIIWQREQPFFLDFDDMLYAPQVQDIWMLIGGNDDFAKANLEILLASYETFRKFDRSLLKLIEPLRALRIINFSAWIALRRSDQSFVRVFPLFTNEQYWHEQIESLSLLVEKIREL